jgi:hypothetical protein
VEAKEVSVEERADTLAHREGGEARPVDGTAGECDELTSGPLVELHASCQQEQPRLRAGPGARVGDVYDVVLVRDDFPIVVRWLFEQVGLVTRQQVVVSAPKMLLGSSVGFS